MPIVIIIPKQREHSDMVHKELHEIEDYVYKQLDCREDIHLKVVVISDSGEVLHAGIGYTSNTGKPGVYHELDEVKKAFRRYDQKEWEEKRQLESLLEKYPEYKR